jgi:hypothetical protein
MRGYKKNMKNTPEKKSMLARKQRRGGHGRNNQRYAELSKSEAQYWRRRDRKDNRKNMATSVKDQLKIM